MSSAPVTKGPSPAAPVAKGPAASAPVAKPPTPRTEAPLAAVVAPPAPEPAAAAASAPAPVSPVDHAASLTKMLEDVRLVTHPGNFSLGWLMLCMLFAELSTAQRGIGTGAAHCVDSQSFC